MTILLAAVARRFMSRAQDRRIARCAVTIADVTDIV
jgi:hypothetical protein